MTLTADTTTDVDLAREMLPGFLVAGLWADAVDLDLTEAEVDADPEGGRARDARDFTWADVTNRERAEGIIEDFLAALRSRPDALAEVHENPAGAGHALWLTVRRRGAGFWAGDWRSGDVLTQAADAAAGDLRVEVETVHGLRVARFAA